MISSEAIQVYEGDGVNPIWKEYCFGDGGSLMYAEKTDYSYIEGDRKLSGDGGGGGIQTYLSGDGHGDGDGDGCGSRKDPIIFIQPGLQE